MEKTTIKVSKRLTEKLKTLGKMGEAYEDVIWRLVEFYEEHRGAGRGKEESS